MTETPPHILIVEDESIIRAALKRLLEKNGYKISEAGSVSEARQKTHPQFDLIISDLRLPGEPGTALIKESLPTPVLLMTSYASLKSAVDAMKIGAADYIAKPFDHDEMLETVARIIQQNQSEAKPESNKLKSSPTPLETETKILGECKQMKQLFWRIRKVAPTESTVLILGESGTGKELVARSIHEQSPRRHAPLISINCAAIPETLIESELFGHEKGSFTGAHTARKGLVEAADRGTLFLDEIGELPLEAQARLLRLLQEKEIRRVGSVSSRKVDVRLVAATHRNLKLLSQTGKFREDLYYRLHVIDLKIPPLRERSHDLELLTHFFLHQACQKHQIPQKKLLPLTLKAIESYEWPGNVREMEHAIERAVILAESPELTPELLGIDLPQYFMEDEESRLETAVEPPKNAQTEDTLEDPSEDLTLEDYFQRFVLEHQDQMTETEIAQKLGISRKCLWERRQKFGIPRKKPNS